MKTKLFLIASLISIGLIFTACQKDNDLTVGSSLEPSSVSTNSADLAKPESSLISDLNSQIQLTNYPDPFVNVTNIQFTLQRRSLVRIYVHELRTGKSVFLFEGWKDKGTHVVQFNASDRKPGEFVAELISGKTIVKEMMYKIEGLDDWEIKH